MERQKIKQDISNYIDELNNAVYHPILKRDIGKVAIDNTIAFFLLLPMLNGEEWTEPMNKSAIAVGAVHAAFDAHDSIHAFDATSNEQQLTVLSGDYFSGIHYRILASLSDFEFIDILAKTIGQINEVKTNVYNQPPTTAIELLDTTRTINSSCVVQFLHHFGFSKYVDIVNVAMPLMSLAPKDKGIGMENFTGSNDWLRESDNKKEVITNLQLEIKEVLNAASFLTPLLKSEIRGKTMPLAGKTI